MTVISHRSALEWHDLRKGNGSRAMAESLSQPVDVLVRYGTHIAQSDEQVMHTARLMPPPSELIHANGGIDVVAPERAIAESLDALNLPKTIVLIDEACGTYRQPRKAAITRYIYAYPRLHVHFLPADSDEITCESASIYGLEPLTNMERLAAFVSDHPGLNGVRKLRRALPYCADGLRSFLETQFHMCAFLPPRWGGCGIPRPQVNHRIDLPGQIQLIAGKPYIVADNAWPEKRLAVELLGATDHAGDGITDTSIREKVYGRLGWDCITMTWKEVQDIQLFMSGAKLLARKLGHRLRLECEDFDQRQQWLFEELASSGEDGLPCRKNYRDRPLGRLHRGGRPFGAR